MPPLHTLLICDASAESTPRVSEPSEISDLYLPTTVTFLTDESRGKPLANLGGALTRIRHGPPMLAKCANPSCTNSFRYLGRGKLFLVGLPPLNIAPRGKSAIKLAARKPEWFWLCEQCSTTMLVTVDQDGNALPVRRLSHGPKPVD